MKKLFFSVFVLIIISTSIGSAVLADDSYGNVYRLYNSSTYEHLYTPDYNEYNTLQSLGWKGEGIAWIAGFKNMSKPVYRLYSPVLQEHLYTKDKNEVTTLSNAGWSIDNNGQPIFDGIGSILIYRLYNPALGRHHLTANTAEYRALGAQGWKQEGPVFSGFDMAE